MKETRVERRERERREEARRRRDLEREYERGYERGSDRNRGREYDRDYGSDYDRDYSGRGKRKQPSRDRVKEIERELEREYRREQEYKQGKKKRKGGIVALVIIIILAVLIAWFWFGSRTENIKPIIMPGSGDFADSPRINILFFGTNQGLSDTIMLFSIDPENNRLDEISIPRDTYYYRPHYSGAAYQKINSVYSSEGYVAACQAASDVLGGVPIHYYAELKPEGVKKIVDAMGGVIVTVPMDMNYVDVDQDLYIDLKAGTQLLNGDQCMQYLRFRSGYANADLGRIGAQQGFLKELLGQAGGLDIAKIAVVANGEVKTNMTLPAQAGLMSRAAKVTGGSAYTHMIPGQSGMQDGLSYYFHDAPATKDLMRQIYASK